jgi:hypothetical protein
MRIFEDYFDLVRGGGDGSDSEPEAAAAAPEGPAEEER